MIKFNQSALEYLKICKERIDTEVPDEKLKSLWVATSPQKWFANFDTDWGVPDLLAKPLNRYDLLELFLASKKEKKMDQLTIRKLIINVLAWGGMRRDKNTGIPALETIGAYEKVCSDLLKGTPAVAAYEEFYNLQNSGQMRGMGPAYYTKLIFFFGDQTGLIMDRWTSRSANLLAGDDFIKLYGEGYVSPKNCSQIYKKYLDLVSELDFLLGTGSLARTEELIFSCSHVQSKVKNMLGTHHDACSAWRKYVVNNT